MHYKADAFSIKPKRLATIALKPRLAADSRIRFGQRKRLSTSDIERLKRMYPCGKSPK